MGVAKAWQRLEPLVLQALRLMWLIATIVFIYIFVDSFTLRWSLYNWNCGQTAAYCPDYYQLKEADALSLEAWGISRTAYKLFLLGCDGVAASVYVLVALLVFMRRSRDGYGMFVAFVLLASGVLIRVDSIRVLPHGWAWAVPWFRIVHAGFWALFLTYPDGRFVPRFSWALAYGYAVWIAVGVAFPSAITSSYQINLFVSLLLYAVALYAQIRRYRAEREWLQRMQIRLFMYAIALVITAGLWDQFWVTNRGLGNIFWSTLAFSAAYVLVPASIGIAIFKYQLWHIRTLANRAAVYTALSACVVGIYVLVVGFLGTLFQRNDSMLLSLLATGLSAILFQPLREQLQRTVNHIMYGDSVDPYAVLSQLGQRLEGSAPHEEALATVVVTLAQAMKLPYVAVALEEGGEPRLKAVYGTEPYELHTLPLVYQSVAVGELRVSTRGPDEAFTRKELGLIADLARQLGGTANSARVTADLARSRERLVSAREEERRRLRRDLHDGLGPALASLTLQFDVARGLVRDRPERAEALLASMRVQLQSAIADIRRLVYALRPPALDELGLVFALRQQAAQYPGERVSITVAGPDPMPPLPAAVEVAAFRIGQEAMNNVVRHAEASRCEIRLWLDDWLHLMVRDDGKGLPQSAAALMTSASGVGLHSMRERAEEVGGVLEVRDDGLPADAAGSVPAHGTTVYVRLPILRGDSTPD